MLENKEFHRYGKQLEMTHQLESFDIFSQKQIQLIKDIEYIDYVYSSYSVSHTDTTKALINGELSLKDVFLSEKYDYDLV